MDYPGFDAKHAVLSINIVDLYEKELTEQYDSQKNKLKAKRGKLIADATNASTNNLFPIQQIMLILLFRIT